MKDVLSKLVKKQNVSADEMTAIGEALATGKLDPALSGAFLLGLAAKGESVEEISALVQVLRAHMTPVPLSENAIDTCGTGGDRVSTINASTLSAFVIAALGGKVAKHGNRAISSKCGSFDVLEALGVKIIPSASGVESAFAATGLAFLFAPHFHPAFQYIGPIRKALDIRTIFNFLGPLLNPAGVTRQVIGVSSRPMAEKLGQVLMALGSEHVILVSSDDGLDEVSVAAPTLAFEFKRNRAMNEFVIQPSKIFSLADVKGGDVAYNAEAAKRILKGEGTPAEKEFISLNAGLGLYVAGIVPSFQEGKKMAEDSLSTDTAFKKLEEIIRV